MSKLAIFGSSKYSIDVLNHTPNKLLSNHEITVISNNSLEHNFSTKKYNNKTSYECDLAVSIGFSQKININKVNSKYGLFNIHQSLLPNYRGRHPIQAMIINGEREYGCTLHVLDTEFDTGNIVKQISKRFKNVPNELTVKKLVTKQSAKLLIYLLINFTNQFNNTSKQPLYGEYIAPKRSSKDSEIKNSFDINKVRNMIKALMHDDYRPYVIIKSEKIYIKNVFLYKLQNKNLLEFYLNNQKVYLEKY
tara:strand:+ start:4047 stop:4793 length:747 start_codon:yes stop_codon:yes gene_type:complete